MITYYGVLALSLFLTILIKSYTTPKRDRIIELAGGHFIHFISRCISIGIASATVILGIVLLFTFEEYNDILIDKLERNK